MSDKPKPRMSKEAYDIMFSMMTYYNQQIIDKLPAPLHKQASKLWRECWTFASEEASKDHPDKEAGK